MQVRRSDLDNLDSEGLTVYDDKDSSASFCPANVAQIGYESCGKKMRQRKNGDTHCPDHGLMH